MSLPGKIKSYSVFSTNILLSAFGGLKHPYKLTFAITSKCNLKCKTCNIWQRKPENELSLEEIDKFFTVNNYFNWIDLTGGEIFLRNDLLDIAKSIKNNVKNLVMLHYPTNGFLTERIVDVTDKIASLDFNKLVITVSIDGDENVHNELRNRENSFQRCIETYKELKKNRHLTVYVGCTLSPFNMDHFDGFFDSLKGHIPDLKYSDIHLNVYHYSESLYSNEPLSYDKDKIIHHVNDFIKKKGFVLTHPIALLEYCYLSNVKGYLSDDKFPYVCKAGKVSCFIDPVGDVYPCTGYNVVMGNLRENEYDLLRILSNENAASLYENIRKGKCPNCWTPCEAYQNILSNMFIRRK